MDDHSIREFYRDQIVFITGGTGFVGKVIIEKLLRSCPDLQRIFVLMRPKRGKSVEERFEEVRTSEIFGRILPENLSKMVPIAGEVTGAGLGIGEEDETLLKDRVTIVFHVAATVKFNDELKKTADLNTLGTKHVMDFCGLMKNLKSVLYLSTAYSNPQVEVIGERVYFTEDPISKDDFLNVVKFLPVDVLSSISEKLLEGQINTYALTKSMAEQVVSDYKTRYPIAMVRPSVITNSAEEPYPGWVEGLHGATGFLCEIGRGMLRTFYALPHLKCNFIPVDIVANTCIVAAWSNVQNSQNSQNSFRIYNCTSDQLNPILFSRLRKLAVNWSRIYPSKHLGFYPRLFLIQNYYLYQFLCVVFHQSLATIYDFIIWVSGGQPMMRKIAAKVHQTAASVQFFSLRPWQFECENYRQLIAESSASNDDFNCDIRTLDWDLYFKNVALGIRKYILKDDDSTLESSRKKIQMFYWIETGFLIVLIWGTWAIVRTIF